MITPEQRLSMIIAGRFEARKEQLIRLASTSDIGLVESGFAIGFCDSFEWIMNLINEHGADTAITALMKFNKNRSEST